MAFPNQDEMRIEFHKLHAQEEKLKADLQPLLDTYNGLREQEGIFHIEKVQPAIDAMAKIRAELFKVQNQRAQIVRFLRDGTGIANTGDPA